MAETELLRRVLDAPDDEHLRLVYADSLQELGDPRGELILLQLKKRSQPLDDDEVEREAELLELHGKRWIGRLAEIAQYLEFDGGFLHGCALREIPAWAAKERAWRTVRHVGVQRDAERLAELLQSPNLEFLRSLRVAVRYQQVAIQFAPAGLEVLIIDGTSGSVLEAMKRPALKRIEVRALSDRFDLVREADGWALEVRFKRRRSQSSLPRSIAEAGPLITAVRVEPPEYKAAVELAIDRSGR